jgi:hypothetical protein
MSPEPQDAFDERKKWEFYSSYGGRSMTSHTKTPDPT